MHVHTPFVIADCFNVPNKSSYRCRDTTLAGTYEHFLVLLRTSYGCPKWQPDKYDRPNYLKKMDKYPVL